YIINRQSPTLQLPYGGSLSVHVVFHIPLVLQAATYHEEVRREKNEMNNSAGIHDQEYISLSYVENLLAMALGPCKWISTITFAFLLVIFTVTLWSLESNQVQYPFAG
ncbi:hypothetical protein Gotur_013612, partial [Gossypium turneri]